MNFEEVKKYENLLFLTFIMGKFREIPSDFELLEIPHFAPVLIEKTKQNKTTISNNLKNSMMSFRDLLKSGTNPTLQSN